MRDHRKLRVFALADRLAMEIYQATASFPKSETFSLTAQMRRASISVPSNVVEGCARRSEREYLRFLNVAYGSSRELDVAGAKLEEIKAARLPEKPGVGSRT